MKKLLFSIPICLFFFACTDENAKVKEQFNNLFSTSLNEGVKIDSTIIKEAYEIPAYRRINHERNILQLTNLYLMSGENDQFKEYADSIKTLISDLQKKEKNENTGYLIEYKIVLKNEANERKNIKLYGQYDINKNIIHITKDEPTLLFND
ncbi:hypothetical protein [Aureivirga marina]|uniref:hypothetical protein n=1 Tax=Aureivirga marina TaxID=1182451 RepID=UPI0018CB05AA|nr:hypothetical protein [Aureivirga marina]